MSRGAPEVAAAAQSTALSKARLRLWLRLLKVSRAVEGRLRERLRDGHATTLPRFDVLAALFRAPEGLTMGGISAALRVSNGNVTGIVDRLEQEGQVSRIAMAGDRRATLVRLTPAGRDQFAALAAEHEGWVDDLLGGVDAGAAAGLIATLEAIAARIEKGGRR